MCVCVLRCWSLSLTNSCPWIPLWRSFYGTRWPVWHARWVNFCVCWMHTVLHCWHLYCSALAKNTHKRRQLFCGGLNINPHFHHCPPQNARSVFTIYCKPKCLSFFVFVIYASISYSADLSVYSIRLYPSHLRSGGNHLPVKKELCLKPTTPNPVCYSSITTAIDIKDFYLLNSKTWQPLSEP